jgi:hypothetical protein
VGHVVHSPVVVSKPVAPKLVTARHGRTGRLVSDDSVSESDDDDFWGSAAAPKPALGKLGGADGKAGGAGNGTGNDLDEWAF